jgi:hypothetical protein
MMAQSEDGMGTGAKVVLALLGVGCVMVLLCCGGAYWWGQRVMNDFRQGVEEGLAELEELDEMYLDDPAAISGLTTSIVEIAIPARYEPSFGQDLTSANHLRKQVNYVSSDGFGRLVIREMGGDDITTRDESARLLADEVSEEGWDFSLLSATTSQQTFVVGGEECVFEFQSGKDTGPGNEMRQVTGSFPSESGLAYLLINDRAEHWDEAAIVAMIESIRIGNASPAGDSGTIEASPAASPADDATETPAGLPADSPESSGADSVPAEPSTPEPGSAQPQ